jgi:RNA recognition motif-containing protein
MGSRARRPPNRLWDGGRLFVGAAGTERQVAMESKLYVGNLAAATTADDLRQLFAQAGTVSGVDVITDRDTGQSKGFAFVTMGSQAEAQKAIGMLNAFGLHDRAMVVSEARPKEQRNGPNARRGGPGGFNAKRLRGHKPRGGNRRY